MNFFGWGSGPTEKPEEKDEKTEPTAGSSPQKFDRIEEDIVLVISQTKCTREEALETLKKHDYDIVNAIMELKNYMNDKKEGKGKKKIVQTSSSPSVVESSPAKAESEQQESGPETESSSEATASSTAVLPVAPVPAVKRTILSYAPVAPSSQLLNREVAYQCIKYLGSLREQEGIPLNRLDDASQSLAALFKVDTKSVDDFLALDYSDATLPQIFEKGLEELKSNHFEPALAAAEADPRYEQFNETITRRNYFAYSEVGSLDYYERRGKVLAKFKEFQVNLLNLGIQATKSKEESPVVSASEVVAESPSKHVHTSVSMAPVAVEVSESVKPVEVVQSEAPEEEVAEEAQSTTAVEVIEQVAVQEEVVEKEVVEKEVVIEAASVEEAKEASKPKKKHNHSHSKHKKHHHKH